MPSSRDRLHPNHLPEFVAYAATRGYEVEPTRGVYERLRIRKPDGRPIIFFQRDRTDHLTVPFDGAELVSSFFERRYGGKP